MNRAPAFLLILLIAAAAKGQQNTLQNGLMACYTFSGNAYDGSGNNYHGIVHGPVLTRDRFGKADSAYQFGGPEDYISIPAATLINSRNFALSMWAYIDSLPGVYQSGTLFSIGFSKDNFHYGVSLADIYGPIPLTGWVMGGYDKIGSTLAQTRTLPPAREWYHLVLSETDDSLIMYINGIRARSVAAREPYFYQSDSSLINIGLRSNGLEPFHGVIDDVSIFNRGLFSAEVKTLYAQGVPCTSLPKPLISDVHLCGLNVASLTASGGTRFRWYSDPGGGDPLFEGNPFVTPPVDHQASYYVVNVVNGIESERVKVTVTVSPQPGLSCNFPTTVNVGTHQYFPVDAVSGTPPYSYEFNFADGTDFTTSDPRPVYRFTAEGEYAVTVRLTDLEGCEVTCVRDVSVRGPIFVPNVITANADTINQTLTVYYRENAGYSRYAGDNTFSMKIYNRWGELVFITSDVARGWQGENTPAGVYYYRIQLGLEEYRGWIDVLK